MLSLLVEENLITKDIKTSAANVALGKPANQTDTHDTFTADRAVDGYTSPDLIAVRSCTHTMSYNTSWLTNVELYVGFSESGFKPGEVGVSYTFELATPVYGQWVRITLNPPVEWLTLCEMEVEGVPYSARNGFYFSVFQGYVHTGTAMDKSNKVGSKLVCASRCSNSNNCNIIHFNPATFTCSLFDSLAFEKGDVENDVCVVNSIAITNNSRAQLFGT
ncbi:hypothetical protein DPMN_072158 [Dreissena polymorpha]|uniref:Fucolectin tachylectin-4 pentraxin-1 domain-containing protein n=1 Tax=Dreissena polymorpha TaxID=45954 RepID=A0A9D4BQ95_DREPO|nr:hypothetical protein DPMN_072158 [Dreissena polymorpha]